MKKSNELISFRRCIVIVAMLFFTVPFLAQDIQVTELTEVDFQNKMQLAKKSSAKTSSAALNNDSDRFFEIVNVLLPTVYVSKGAIVKVSGEGAPVKMNFSDANTTTVLNSVNKLFSSIELVSIMLKNKNDINKAIDVSLLKGFDSLKYIYIKSYFECSESEIRSFLRGTPEGITIYYIMTNPS